jgi:hypothetical protein
LGFKDPKEINYFKFLIGDVEPSSWVSWPYNYKFIDVEILVGSN